MQLPPNNLPKDPRHQRFADHVLAGCSLTEAYVKAGYKVSRSSAQSAGRRLVKQPDVAAYIRSVQESAKTASILSVHEILQFCARVVRTPITALDPDSDQHADLIKSYRRSESELGTNTSLEKHDPFKAIEIHIKLSGDDPEANALKEIAAAIGHLGGQVLPDDRM